MKSQNNIGSSLVIWYAWKKHIYCQLSTIHAYHIKGGNIHTVVDNTILCETRVLKRFNDFNLHIPSGISVIIFKGDNGSGTYYHEKAGAVIAMI